MTTTKTLTPEQVEAQRRFALAVIDSAEEKDRENHRDAANKVVSALLTGRQPWYNDLEVALTQPARLALWDTVHQAHLAQTIAELPDWQQHGETYSARVPDRLTTLGDVADELRDRLLRNLSYLHGSTDPFSRLEADATRSGEASWLRDVGQWGTGLS